MTLEAGTRLGPYEILSLLGKGGMGEVYKANDTRLSRSVAIKVLPDELSQDPTYRKRLEHEAKAISQLQHPNVCMLLDIGSEGTAQFLVMEYLEGETLEDRLRHGPLPIDELRRIGGEIAEAVEAAHRAGIIHRDLKPGNVMLTAAGAKVLDFGLAKEQASSLGSADASAATATRALTGEGRIIGTMPYMAPEQLQGSPADSRTDIWALGCILYEMATGERPFRGQSQASLISSIMTEQPEPPSRKQALSPERLDWLVGRCLEKDPERRWQAARDVGIELESLDRQTPPESPSGADRSRRWIAVAATMTILLLAALGWQFWKKTRSVEGEGASASRVTNAELFDAPAVLTFENYTDDPDLDRLARGIPLAIRTRWAAWGSSVSVLDRAARLSGGGDACSALEGESRFLIDGTLSRRREGLRITARLLDCVSGETVWSNTYDRSGEDVFALDDDIANQISIQSQQAWAGGSSHASDGPGNYGWHMTRRTKEDNAKALALGLESENPVMIWEPQLQGVTEGWADSLSEATTGAQTTAQRALDLNERDWGWHLRVGVTTFFTEDRDQMLIALQRADELAQLPVTHAWLGLAFAIVGRPDEGLAKIAEAIRLSPEDPSLPNWLFMRARAQFIARRYGEARDAALEGIGHNSNDGFNNRASSFQVLAASYAHLGQLDEARDALERALQLRPGLTLEVAMAPLTSGDEDVRARYGVGLRLAGLVE